MRGQYSGICSGKVGEHILFVYCSSFVDILSAACCMCLYGIDWSLVDFNGLPAISMHAA